MMKRYLLFNLVFLHVPANANKICDNVMRERSVKKARIGAFDIRLKNDFTNGHASIEIFKGPKRVYSQTGERFFANFESDQCDLPKAGTSVSGARPHELVVQEWTGGAHCRFNISIIALESQPILIQKIEGKDTERFVFFDHDRDGAKEIKLYDWTFAYWHESFSNSVASQVILKYQTGQWRFASDLMRLPPRPLAQEFEKMIRDGKAEFTASSQPEARFTPPRNLMNTFVKFVYAGQADLGLKLVDEVWPANNSNRQQFLVSFAKELRQSPYYNDLKSMNTHVQDFLK